MKKVIYNIKNERGNTVANQFLTIEGTDYTFTSWIKSGYIPASENCYHTDIDIRLVNEEAL